ncbi:hypothetical protein K503DRAFT_574548 [Rhizopogon vinicolor AM-OR11-026]|uniref:Uncharacterized protein n=1 Tax=Rhizopogon vinicolor AM-OR11-026 TaxID=1314800 RepID=A0A1B7MJN5_9AGAM|nr:hypothetical protein K503DRAFT_574548 [Rhizopogon vinicolor AM-OR11-026]
MTKRWIGMWGSSAQTVDIATFGSFICWRMIRTLRSRGIMKVTSRRRADDPSVRGAPDCPQICAITPFMIFHTIASSCQAHEVYTSDINPFRLPRPP